MGLDLIASVLPSIRAAAKKNCNRPEDVEDVVQEAALRVLLHCRDTPGKKTWAFRVTRNLCVDLHRRNKRYVLDSMMDEVLVPSPESEVSARQRVASALRALPEVNVRILRLSYLEGMKTGEIAEALGMSPSIVSIRLCRARKQLRSILEE